MVSIVIPHKNRHSLLYMTLNKFNEQNVSNFEVIVVDDGSDIPPQEWIELVYPDFHPKYDLVWEKNSFVSPNTARNKGVSISKYDNIVISGSDTIPSRTFVMNHVLDLQRNTDKIIQGFTPFHPQVMDTEFMVWLDSAGIQANWGALRNENGWKRNADGFCLTTNLSMSKRLFDNIGGFSTEFPGAAWDDIEFGIRSRKLGVETIFNHKAVNFHYHKYNIQTFASRQQMEGRNRKHLCLTHPEMAMQLFNLDIIRQAMELSLEEFIYQSIQLSYLKGLDEEKHKSWMGTMQLASFKGVVESLESHECLKIIPELINQESSVYIFALLKAYAEGNNAYADHCLAWVAEKEPLWLSEYITAAALKFSRDDSQWFVHANNSLSSKHNKYALELIG